jgi:hypothetical protein
MKTSNRYVKVEGHPNWFLVLEENQSLPDNFNIVMQEKILRSEVYTLHGGMTIDKSDFDRRLKLLACQQIDYQTIANKYGTILIRPTGSYMPLHGNEITEERFDAHFPIDSFSEIVICENDKKAELEWVKKLQKMFPEKAITTINFFDLRSEQEVSEYFKHAKYITFSTTFSKYEWFEKLSRNLNSNHKVIGYCHNEENWKTALEINPNVEIINQL